MICPRCFGTRSIPYLLTPWHMGYDQCTYCDGLGQINCYETLSQHPVEGMQPQPTSPYDNREPIFYFQISSSPSLSHYPHLLSRLNPGIQKIIRQGGCRLYSNAKFFKIELDDLEDYDGEEETPA